MVELTAEQIAQRVFDLDLLDQRQLKEVWGAIGSRQVTGDEFRQLLERRELLTNYQSERLMRGDRTGFFYGDFKVLYLIGTGTFARVYRAAHRHTGEIRAVKVLRRRAGRGRAVLARRANGRDVAAPQHRADLRSHFARRRAVSRHGFRRRA